jgi:CheY-like chemotaxis protein
MSTSPISRTILQNWDVLVVDDEPDNLEVAVRILKHYGATVCTAMNGQEALEILTKLRPRFIICDISMPVMDGWEFMNTIKRDRRTLDIPVIALTAHAMPGDRERAITAGFHNYLTKPLTPATFMRDLLSLLVDVPELAGMLSQSSS